MKTRLRVLLSAIMLTPLIFLGVAGAVEDSTNTQTTERKPPVSVNEKVIAQATVDNKLTLQQRIDKRKAELKTKLTALEQKNIPLKCKASQQGAISSLKGRITGIDTSRNNVHRELVDRLTKISDKLEAADIDTTQLDAQTTELQAKIETFKTDLATYKLAVEDLKEVDCVKDPTGFKAALEAARAAREKVAQDGQAIRVYVKDTIKPTLSQLRSQLEDKKAEGSNE